MHELAHQYGARDHYHDEDTEGNCINHEICSKCGDNKRPKTCIMNIGRTDITQDTVLCDECKEDILQHLMEYH